MRIVYPPQLDERKDDPLVKSVIQLYELINLMGLDESNIASKSLKGQQILLNNNDKLQARNSSGVAKDLVYLDTTNYLALSQLAQKGDTTNSTGTDLTLQMGWGYIQGNGSDTQITKAVTFPQAFSAAPYVFPCMLGEYSNAAAPTAVSNFNLTHSSVIARFYVIDITTTGFNISYRFDAAWAATIWKGFTWLAIGSV